MIPDLVYQPDYISPRDEARLIQKISEQVWMNPFSRRVQHYGYVYDYKKREVTKEMFLGHLPDWLNQIGKELQADGYIEEKPDQVIINEYIPGQGIAPHVDCEPCFGDTIVSISLGSHCVMDFSHLYSDKKHSQILQARSLVVMKREARYDWKHGIPARKTDKIEGIAVKRLRRLSLTFRKVILT